MDLQSDFLALPYLTLAVGIIGSLLLFLSTDRQIKALRSAIKLQKERIVLVEGRLRANLSSTGKASKGSMTRETILDLTGQGYTADRIAQQSGLSRAEVDFVLAVEQYAGPAGEALTIGKMS